jgi:uncharacterized protein YjdB
LLSVVACEKTTTATSGKIAAIEIDPTSISLSPGAAAPLTARVLDEDGALLSVPVFWAAEDERIARVSSQGVVTAVAAGRTQIAASRSGTSAVVPVVVSALPPTLLRVSPNATQLAVGGTTTLLAEVFNSGGARINGLPTAWSSANSAVATVTPSGVVTAVGQGTVLINAIAAGLNGAAVVTVQPVPVATISVSPTTANVQRNRTVQLAATLRDAAGRVLTGRAVSWASEEPSRARVQQNGIVTGVQKGQVRIIALSEGKSASAMITVR